MRISAKIIDECPYCSAPKDKCLGCKIIRCKFCKRHFAGAKQNQDEQCCAFCWSKR